MKANSEKTKQSKKATRRVLAGVLCGASVLSLVLSLVMPPISQAIANDAEAGAAEETVAAADSSTESTDVENTNNGDAENRNSDDAEGGEGEDAAAADLPADDTGAESAAQPADDGQSVYKAVTVANEGEARKLEIDSEGYALLKSDEDLSTYLDLPAAEKPAKLRLTADISSSNPIVINHDTTIDLANHKLYYSNGNPKQETKEPVCAFITISKGYTLTVKGEANDSKTEATSGEPGQPAEMQFIDESVPQSLTYYVTESTPNGFGTRETTYQHTVANFGAIVACKKGYVNQVISVEDGGTLNLQGGMITTPRPLGNDGHVIFSQGIVNISGGYVTNGSGGGWGGGLCVTGANASLEMTDGVIAGNKAASGGGIYADKGAALNLLGGVISGNATYANVINHGENTYDGGYGGGVYTMLATVTISGSACITNNRAEARIDNKDLYNKGLLGGGGIASTNGAILTMTGGSVTANYSHEAGGGIYAGFYGQGVEFTMSSGFIAGNKSDNAEGGGLRISGGTIGEINAENASNRIYITNNKTMTGSNDNRGGDWGGGGVFVQEGGTLNIAKTLITNNKAGGWGGGIGACPTGKTIVSHSKGAAIYDNKDNVDQYGNKLTAYHYSAGGHGKNEDHDEVNYVTPDFQKSGHKDFFLVRNKNGADKTIAVVLGKMLGGKSAGWRGTCDGNPVTIDPNGGAEAKWMFGLEADPTPYAKGKAQAEATTIISGNYSYTHGGGIMTNGDLIVGEVNDLRVYPSMKLHATKALVDARGDKQSLNGHEYKFQLLRQEVNGTKAPSWKDDGTLDMGDCSGAGEATVDQSSGSITFDSGKDYSSGQYVFYLVEEPISGQNELDIKFDKTIYKIEVTVGGSPYKTESLMTFPINYYKVESVAVFKKAETDNDFAQLDRSGYSFAPSEDGTEATVTIGNRSDNPTFTNKIVPPFSWTPKATKVVEGGEMKAFTLQLAKDSEFKNMIGTAVTSGSEKTQTLPFMDENNETVELKYSLSDIRNNPDDPGGSTGGSFKTFTYYVREKTDGSQFSHYTYDHSVYKFTVEPTYDDKKGEIKCRVTYRKGTVDPGGTWKNTDNVDHEFPDTNPTFTNTYSTSLPLSGMSGVTLTYLAGAAVLCAAAAWMHIRRKANAKGGKRRE
ncbi:hypothetical protein [Collinsella aerofaciens]|uniref:hypothetical protein n=1 Tax=Collinsella aerofaciens TaxID=74426 RepID=UPI0034A1DCEE